MSRVWQQSSGDFHPAHAPLAARQQAIARDEAEIEEISAAIPEAGIISAQTMAASRRTS
jgi:hypothetical protein